MKTLLKFTTLVVSLCTVGSGSHLLASPVTFSAAEGSLAASVTFAVSGNSLIVTLSNDSLFDVLTPNQLLTSVFFDISGGTLGLKPSSGSAVLNDGSIVLFDSAPAGGIVGGEWAYKAGISGQTQFGQNYGISSAGFGIFGQANFPGADLDRPGSVAGMNYGLTSVGDNPLTGNRPVTGGNPLIQSSVVFTIPCLPDGFDPSVAISHVSWQYGTTLNSIDSNEPVLVYVPIPEPTAGVIFVAGSIVVLLARRRF